MPSSGLPIENLFEPFSNAKTQEISRLIIKNADHAMKQGMFIEWLESFVGAYNKTKDPTQAANAGITEWDL